MKSIGVAGLATRSIERLEPCVVELVGPSLDAADLLGRSVERAGVLADVGEQRHRLCDQLGALDDGVAHLAHLRLEVLHLEQHDRLGGLLHLVDRVVHRRDQVLDVAAVEGRDEGAAHADQHFAGDVVGLLLVAHDRAIVARYRFPAIEHASQGLRRRGD